MSDRQAFHTDCPSCHKVSFVLPEELAASGSYKCPSCGLRFRAEEFWTEPSDEEYTDLSFTNTVTAKNDDSANDPDGGSRLPEELDDIIIPGKLALYGNRKQDEKYADPDSASPQLSPQAIEAATETPDPDSARSETEKKPDPEPHKKPGSPFKDPDRQRHHRDSFQARTLSFPVELKYRSISYGRKILFSCITLALVLTLLLQYAWYNPQHISGINFPKPLCKILPCSEPAITSDNYRSLFLQVREQPDHPNALLVSFAFSNDSTREIPFPIARLSFYDTQGVELIARRDFTPGEYLPEPLRLLDLMPAGSQAQAEMVIVDPGPDAARYTLVLLPEL